MAEETGRGCCGKIGELLKKIDYFGVTFLFRINKNDKFRSETGGFWFLIYLTIAITYIGFTVISYFGGGNFNATIIDKSIFPSPRLNFGSNNFTFAVRITFDNDTGIEKSGSGLDKLINYYTNFVEFSPEGKNKLEFKGRPCTSEDFYQKADDPLFNRTNISEFICFNDIAKYDIFGIYTDPSLSYFEVNTFLNSSWVKDDYAKVQKIFKENQFKLSLYYIETLHDVSSSAKPIFYQIESIYTYLDINFIKRNNLNFQSFVYDLDENIITPNFKNTTYMKLYSKDDISVSISERDTSTIGDNLQLAKFFLKAINLQKIVKRSYQKIPEVLASISGLLVNLLIGIGIVMTLLNAFKAKQEVMHGILKYKENIKDKNKETLSYLNDSFNDPKIKKILDEAKISRQTIYSKDRKSSINDVNIKDKQDDIDFEVEKVELKERLYSINSNSSMDEVKKSDIQTSKNPFNITVGDICCLICCCRSIKNKQQIYENSESKFNYYMDLITYMKKMQEIDIIKYLLLDIDTLNLMNFISKPSVSLTKSLIETKEYKKFFNINEDAVVLDEQNIDSMKKSYLKIISKPQISYLEKRILELFDLQIKEIMGE